MTTRKILVIGDSHTRALLNARAEVDVPGVSFDIHWLRVEKNGTARGDLPEADAVAQVTALAPGDLLAVALYGTLHNVFGLLQHDVPFWVCDEGADASVPQGRTLITRDAFKTTFSHFAVRTRGVTQLLQACQGRRVHLMTPPPKGDTAFIESRLQKYRDRLVAEVGITEPEVRLRLWQLEALAVGEQAAREGAALLMPPAECVAPDGFLAPHCYGPDATHANTAYGASVLRQLAGMLP